MVEVAVFAAQQLRGSTMRATTINLSWGLRVFSFVLFSVFISRILVVCLIRGFDLALAALPAGLSSWFLLHESMRPLIADSTPFSVISNGVEEHRNPRTKPNAVGQEKTKAVIKHDVVRARLTFANSFHSVRMI